MKIGFDISQTNKTKAGCGYFADNLIRNLAKIDTTNNYILYATFGDFYWDRCHKQKSFVNNPNFIPGLVHHSYKEAKNFWKNPPVDYEVQLGSPDIIHANNFFCPYSKFSHTKIIYTLYDLSFICNPEWTTEINRLGCFNGVFNASLNADFIISISEYTRKHFLETFPHFSEKKIKTVYPSCRFSESTKKIIKPNRFSHLKENKFWLCVSTLEPRKNHKCLLEAYSKLNATQNNVMPLVLVGGDGWLIEDIKNISNQKIYQNVEFLGYVNDLELEWLYQNCFCSLYPSLFEGFGLPVLEAMTLGAAVIASNSSSIPEIVGSAGMLVDPNSPDDFFYAMQQMLKTEQQREYFIEAGLEQSRKFSQLSSAKKVLEIYHELVS